MFATFRCAGRTFGRLPVQLGAIKHQRQLLNRPLGQPRRQRLGFVPDLNYSAQVLALRPHRDD
jgi:hypothetical protein